MEKEFGIDIHREAFNKILPTHDGNFLLVGGFSYDGWDNPPTYLSGRGGILVKINSQGDTLWFKKYEGQTQQMAFLDALEMPDHSIMVVGENQTTGGYTSLMKFDEEGNLIWQQLYDRNPNLSEILFSLINTQDKGFLMAGQAFPIVPPDQGNATDAWLLKVDSVGCPEPLCVMPLAVDDPPRTEVSDLEVYPNPFTAALHILLPPEATYKDCRIRISDTAGRVLITQDTKGKEDVVISTEKLPGGMYIVTVEAEGYRGVEKVVKIN